ncbi:hypothetical protein SDC9_80089 [bioreactor metagenome]|uniref:Xanthine dehydrogenase subunit A n=1 Tax=bioreactor metagenome TaxID=1076179 RepID=A0A644Z460_9ZZZZ
MKEIALRARGLLEEGQDFALAVMTDKQGISPRDVGTLMLVERNGACTGSVGGGSLEAAVKDRAVKAIEEGRSTHMTHDNFEVADLGLACGCKTTLYIDYVNAKNPLYFELYTAMAKLYTDGGRARLCIRTDTAPCTEFLLYSDGETIGEPAESITYSGKPFEAIEIPDGRYYIFPVGAEPKAIVLGGGHVGSKVAPLLAFCGFDTVVLEDREPLIARGRFPDTVRTRLLETFEAGVFDAESCGEDTYVVIATRSHELDRAVLEQALKTKAYYIGMMGSRSKRDRAFEYLKARGFTDGDLARVHAPIGLALKAKTPQEIAVSIAGEMILRRHSLS